MIAERVCQGLGLHPDRVREFADKCEERCRDAYEAGCDWMVKIGRAAGDRGRAELYVVLCHWRDSWLKNPALFLRR